MDYDKLIERWRNLANRWENGEQLLLNGVMRIEDELRTAATALSTLQGENKKLRGELEYEQEHANAYLEECGQWEAENEKLRAELEQVKRAFDGICEYIDSEGFLRKQFCENGNPDLEPCVCPSLKEHPGYIDSDDCEGCDHFCNSWRGQKED